MKESDMYPFLKCYFEERGYLVYPEIEPRSGYKRADIVAIKEKNVVIVEMKMSFGLSVMQQAYEWKGYANQIYIAIPKRNNAIPMVARKILVSENIGLLEVDINDYFSKVQETEKSEYQEEAKLSHYILDFITPYHLEGKAGGSKTGGHITGYKVTMLKTRDFLKDRGWTRAQEIAENVETHYSGLNIAASLKQALINFESDWCEYRVIKGKGYFRLRSVLK